MIRTLLFVAVLVSGTALFGLVSVVGGLLGAPASLHEWGHRRWAGWLLTAAGVEVRVEGARRLNPGEPAILACNHQSIFDIWALLHALPGSLRFVAKEELSRIPIFAGAFRAAGHVFIDRSSPASALRTMEEAGRKMRRDGLALVIFPEGTRSPDGRLRSFKRGPFRLAKRTTAAIHPVALDGGARILAKGRRRIRAGVLRIGVGEPVPPAEAERMDRGELARRVHREVARMLEEMGDREDDGGP